jgi:hypothetical protein
MFNNRLNTLFMAILLLGMSMTAAAQKKTNLMSISALLQRVQLAKAGRSVADPNTVKLVNDVFAAKADRVLIGSGNIVGTWNVHIAESDGGGAPFDALQTFNGDGTFVETSSLLGVGGEGPAHGSWERVARNYRLMFELFVFDPETGECVGRVRVRNLISLPNTNTINSLTVVDFIEPDGNVIEAIDSGPFTGTRLFPVGI